MTSQVSFQDWENVSINVDLSEKLPSKILCIMLLFSQTLEFGFLQFILVALTWQRWIPKKPNKSNASSQNWGNAFAEMRMRGHCVKPCCQISRILYWLVKVWLKKRPTSRYCYSYSYLLSSQLLLQIWLFSYPGFWAAVNWSQCQLYFLIQVLGRRRRWSFVKVMMSTLVSQEQSRWQCFSAIE